MRLIRKLKMAIKFHNTSFRPRPNASVWRRLISVTSLLDEFHLATGKLSATLQGRLESFRRMFVLPIRSTTWPSSPITAPRERHMSPMNDQ